MRTINAPGVEIKEIDKSQYSPAMVGTASYIMGYTDKGEPYEPMEFTSRTAWTTYYGEPDNEAERYAYAAVCEVLNNNGRLYFARLPYDNDAFEKMVAFKYEIAANTALSSTSLSALGVPFMSEVSSLDNTIDVATKIQPAATPVFTVDLSSVDAWKSAEEPILQGLTIVDKTCGTYANVAPDSRKGEAAELIGIMPIVTTAANAMYAQSFITGGNLNNDELTSVKTLSGYSLLDTDYATSLNDVFAEAVGSFPTLQLNTTKTGSAFDRENLKKIGIVVFKMFLDPSNGNKVNFTAVESFVGSLGKNDKDPNTGVTTFIDDIVNTNSQYIYTFTNVGSTGNDNDDICFLNTGCAGSLGFYTSMTKEDISKAKLWNSVDTCFNKVSDINERDIDIVCDAGLANIYSYMTVLNTKGPYDLTNTTVMGGWATGMTSNSDAIKNWKAFEQKLDTFCKKTRKDCMFIADAPRPMVLAGNKKIVRATKPSNTIDANILPNIKWITGLNTSYGAGYLDWFEIADDYTGELFWCPPSIKAMGCYINTDVNYNYWDAPAGLTRGLIAATDVSFSPTMAQAGAIYEKNWNYAINYPADGIVLEGQKTFQVKPSAFDRVNVRRLFLRLERAAYKVARYFVYEGNTAYTRQRLVDRLNPYFKEAKIGGGIYDYKIICDESVNDPDTIDRNELKVKIGIKPVKTAEFILIDFIALSTGGSFEEAMG